MINEENLNKLYNRVIENTELTTKELNDFGFHSTDLNELIERGRLIRVKRGLYSLKGVDELFYYGKRLIAQREYDKATQCFQKCFEIDPNHAGVCFQLFLRCIQNQDYKKAFEYFDVFYHGENEFYNADSNFYLYLLSMITELPEKYREYAKFLKFDDFKVDSQDKRYYDVFKQNKIRLSSFNQKFTLAAKQLNETMHEKGSVSVQDIVIKTLLHQAIEVQIQNKNYIVRLIKEKKYEDIIAFYENMRFYHLFSMTDKYILILVNELMNIIRTKSIPEKKAFQEEGLFEAIDSKNFEFALNLSSTNNQKYNVSNEDNAIFLLLYEIVYQCKELNGQKEQQIIPLTTLEQTSTLPEESCTTQNTFSSGTFADILKFLMNGDFYCSFKTLRTYLASFNKSYYEFLIVDLIKISLLEKDIAFTKPMTTLTLISRENYSFDLSTYIQEFYIALSQNKLEEARIYLDIISKGSQIGQDCVITDALYQVLEASEKMLGYKRNLEILNGVNEALEKSQIKGEQQVSYPKSQEHSMEDMVPKIQKPIQMEEITDEKRNLEKKFINQKYEELLDKKSILLLDPMDANKINRIFEMIENYPDMVAFVIGRKGKQQVVLKYNPSTSETVDCKNLISLGSTAYKERNYDKCIEIFLQLLQLYHHPKSYIYAKLGLAYMKKGQKSQAIDYLTIATDLAKKENIDYDYSDLIANLRGDIPSENQKPRFKMIPQDFDYSDVGDYYGVDNFEEINSFIIQSGLDVESACEQLELSLEEIDIIKLIYAREFYTQGNQTKGDAFLKSVERSKNKTENVKKIFEEVRKNKKFYQNRKSEKNTKLVFTLLPKKKSSN